jgi:hypothetical protein
VNLASRIDSDVAKVSLDLGGLAGASSKAVKGGMRIMTPSAVQDGYLIPSSYSHRLN